MILPAETPETETTPFERKIRRVIAALKSLGITREPQDPRVVRALKVKLYTEVDKAAGRLRVEESLFRLEELLSDREGSRYDDEPLEQEES